MSQSKLRLVGLFGLRLGLAGLMFFGSGELFLRVVYRDGYSFASHVGPMVRRFERDFHFNHYDGPSRGPEVIAEKKHGVLRVLIQGDSITWGQGLEDERQLFSSLLLEKLRGRNPRIEMAVLARGGREIDGHLRQLQKWGPQIRPDVIIYQEFSNDMELDKSSRPESRRFLQRIPFGRWWLQHSYLGFFLDYRLKTLGGRANQAYVPYMLQHFAQGTEAWRRFEAMFQKWAREAQRWTPRVVVALYPRLVPDYELGPLDARVRRLAEASGCETIDLIDSFAAFQKDYTRLWATPMDPHPNARAHAIVAQTLFERLAQRWPDLLRRGDLDG